MLSADARALAGESDQIGRLFAATHHLHDSDFHALLHILVAERAGRPLTSSALQRKLGVSGSAITYLVKRMAVSGHLRRDTDPHDRRKVVLRYAEHGSETAAAFFEPLAAHTRHALAGIADADLMAADRVFKALTDAMCRFREELTASADHREAARRDRDAASAR